MLPETKMVNLGPLVERAYNSLGTNPSPGSPKPFNYDKVQKPPMLRPRGMNRILVFPGAFNPPHKGHLDLLKHVFENAGHNMFLSGAIIVPLDDSQLQKKLQHDQQQLTLPREKRVQLWREAKLPNKYWVFDGSTEEYTKFTMQLREEIRLPGIELQFILLAGPDWVRPDFLASAVQWGCDDLVTSDISRPVDFRGYSSLSRVLRCEPWQKSTYDRKRLAKHFHAIMCKSLQCTREKAVDKAMAQIENVWRCRRECHPKGWVLFIPVNLAEQPKQPPSSTKLREIIAKTADAELQNALEEMGALCPALLAQFARECKPTMSATKALKPMSLLINPQNE